MLRRPGTRGETLMLILTAVLWRFRSPRTNRAKVLLSYIRGTIMFRFIGGVVLGIVIGLYLGSFPGVSEGLAQIGQILSISALATLL